MHVFFKGLDIDEPEYDNIPLGAGLLLFISEYSIYYYPIRAKSELECV